MKRSGFKKPSLDEVKAKRAVKIAKALKNPPKVKIKRKKRVSIDKTEIPAWFKSIPTGSHGNTPTQKRYWKLISDFVRQRDFNTYKGRCVSCTHRFSHWKEAQGGHYKPFTLCNAYFKFSELNVHAQCSTCNYNLKRSSADIGHSFGEELKRRYGDNHLKWIEKENLKHHGQKLENGKIVELANKIINDNPWFILP